MPALPTVADLKTYLGITGSQDDALIAQTIIDAVGKAERDTGRTFAAASNTTTRYSTDGQSSLIIHDRPYTDPSRTVQLSGVTMTEGTGVWFLPDRRDQNVTATIQLKYYDRSRGDWYKADPQWFDKDLDNPRYLSGSPNDLVISGILGMPFPDDDVVGAIRLLMAWLYWNAKSGASGVVQLPTGESLDLEAEPPRYQEFVRNWRIRTAVSSP
jgi:gp6-like head-tail connector protein